MSVALGQITAWRGRTDLDAPHIHHRNPTGGKS
jgi:hypothetical protein